MSSEQYTRCQELLNMGIPSICISFNPRWDEKAQKYKKDPIGLPSKNHKTHPFTISEMGVEECREFLQWKGKSIYKCNACIILCNKKSPIWALDIDHGVDKFNELKFHNDATAPPTHNTINGGKHYLYLQDDRITSEGEFDDGNGLSGDIKCGTGWVYAPPSTCPFGSYEISGKTYNSLDDFRTLTDEEWSWLQPIIKGKHSVKKVVKNLESFDDIHEMNEIDSDEDTSLVGTDFEELTKIVMGIDVESKNPHTGLSFYNYKSWFEVMCGIHTETKGDKNGLKLFCKWSKQMKSSYDKNECTSKWQTLNEKGKANITIGSLIDLSSYKGWEHVESTDLNLRYSFDMRDDYNIMDFIRHYSRRRLNNKEDIVECLNNMLRVIVRIEDEGGYYVVKKSKTKRFKNTETVENYFTILKGTHCLPTCDIFIKNRSKPLNIEKFWYTYHTTLPYFQRVVFEPETKIENEFNIWSGWLAKEVDTINMDYVDWFLNHIKGVWANDNEKAYEFIINWFAHLIQKPKQKTGRVILLIGDEGDGKSSVLNYMRKLIYGTLHTVAIQKFEDMLGNFNSIISHKILVELPEVPQNTADFHKFYNIFKTMITDDDIGINEKFKPQRTETSYHNFILSSNHENCMPINSKARRFAVLKTSNRYNGDDKYWGDFYDKCEQLEYADHIFTYFKRFQMTIDIPKEPVYKSEFQHEMAEQNSNSVESFIREFTNGIQHKSEVIELFTTGESNSLTCTSGFFPKMGVRNDMYSQERDLDSSIDLIKNGIKGENILFKYYQEYCKESGEKPFKLTLFRRSIKDIPKIKKRDGYHYKLIDIPLTL